MAQTEPRPRLLAPKDISEELGLSKDRVYRLLKEGVIPAKDISEKSLKKKRTHRPMYRVTREALEKWLASQT